MARSASERIKELEIERKGYIDARDLAAKEIARLDKDIEELREDERTEALEKVKAFALEQGYALDVLLGKASKPAVKGAAKKSGSKSGGKPKVSIEEANYRFVDKDGNVTLWKSGAAPKVAYDLGLMKPNPSKRSPEGQTLDKEKAKPYFITDEVRAKLLAEVGK